MPPTKLLVRKIQETPKTTHIIVVYLGYLTEHEDKTLLLKTSNTLVTGFGEINLEVTWMLFPEDYFSEC